MVLPFIICFYHFIDDTFKFLIPLVCETGTASKEIEDKTFSMKIKRERIRSMDQSNQRSSNIKKKIESNVDEPIMNISEQYDERVQNPLHKYKY